MHNIFKRRLSPEGKPIDVGTKDEIGGPKVRHESTQYGDHSPVEPVAIVVDYSLKQF